MFSIAIVKLRLQIIASLVVTLALASCKTEVKVKAPSSVNTAKPATTDTPSAVKIISPAEGASAISQNYKTFSLVGTCAIEGSKILLSTVNSDNSTKSLGTATCSKSTWNADLDLSDVADGDVKIYVTASTSSGTKSTPALLTIKKDTTLPTATLTTSATTFNTSPIAMQLTFSESVTGLTRAKFTTSNVTLSNLSGSGKTYTFDASPDSNGSFSISLSAGSVVDIAGNSNLASSTFTQTFNNPSPTVVISSTSSAYTNSSPIPVTVTFSTAVTGFNASNMTFVNGSASGFAGSGSTYTFNLTPTGQGVVSVDIAAAVVTDSLSNPNLAAAQFTRTYDTAAPTVAISSSASSTTNLALIPVTVTFSEAVTGFTSAGVTVGNGTLSSFTGSGTTYTFNIAPTSQGAVTIDVPANKAQDAATNNNTAATQLSRTYDSVVPTLTFSSVSAGNPGSTLTPTILGTASESSTVTLYYDSSCTTSKSAASANTVFASPGIPLTSNVGANTTTTIYAKAVDPAGNVSTCTSLVTYTHDNVAPTVSTIIASQNTGSYKQGAIIVISLLFSESVTVVGTPTLALNSGATVNYTSGSGSTLLNFSYTIGSGENSSDLDISSTSSLTAGTSIKDATGNNASLTLPTPGSASTISLSKDIVVDTTTPTITYTSISPTSPGSSLTPTVTLSLSEASMANGLRLYSENTCTTTASATVTGTSGSNTVTTSSLTANATTTLYAKMTDVAGNASSCTSLVSYTNDSTAPTVSNVSSSSANGTYITGQTVAITAQFSENVTVTGNPTITLETGTTDEVATYASGSGTTTLTFNYTLLAGDTSSDLDYVSTSALALSGGTIKDASGNNATLTLPTVGGASSIAGQKAIVISPTANTAPTFTFTAPIGNDDDVTIGSNVTITWTDSDPDDNATIKIYYKTSSSGACATGGTQIGANIQEDNATNSLTWSTTGRSEGYYWLCTNISDGTNAAVEVYSGSIILRPSGSCYWTGRTSTAWATASNWLGCSGTIPNSGNSVIIPLNATNQPTISADQGISEFAIGTGGGTITISAGTTFTISNDTSVKSSIKFVASTSNCNTCMLARSNWDFRILNNATFTLGDGIRFLLDGTVYVGSNSSSGHFVTTGGSTPADWPEIYGDSTHNFLLFYVEAVSASPRSSVTINGLALNAIRYEYGKFEFANFYQVNQFDNISFSMYSGTVLNQSLMKFSNCGNASFNASTWSGLNFVDTPTNYAHNIEFVSGSCTAGNQPTLTISGSGNMFGYRYALDPNSKMTWTNASAADVKTCTWNTAGTTSWTSPSNWLNCSNFQGYPQAIDSVIIPSGGTQPTISNSKITVYSFASGAGGGTITLDNTTFGVGMAKYDGKNIQSNIGFAGVSAGARGVLAPNVGFYVGGGATLTLGHDLTVYTPSYGGHLFGYEFPNFETANLVINNSGYSQANWTIFDVWIDANDYGLRSLFTTAGYDNSHLSTAYIDGLVINNIHDSYGILNFNQYYTLSKFDHVVFNSASGSSLAHRSGLNLSSCETATLPAGMVGLTFNFTFSNPGTSGPDYSYNVKVAGSCSGATAMSLTGYTGVGAIAGMEYDPLNKINWN